jgi:hypothetical protein
VTLNRVWIPSPNYSSRGAPVRLIVLHTAEGALTYQSLGNFFASSSSGVSSHVGIDDTPNTVGEYVRRDHKAWTQGNANPYSVAVELCAFAEWTPAEWDRHPNMLANCAAWIAEEAAAFEIPLVRLTAAQAQGGAAGVCQHVDLGAAGGGHWDCGPGFPMDRVIAMAADGTTPTTEEDDLTPEQDALLRKIFNLLVLGVAEFKGDQAVDVSYLYNALLVGVNEPNPVNIGALTTLDYIGRDALGRLDGLAARLDAIEAKLD